MAVKIYFDLDGTLFDLYGKKDWLYQIENEISGVFKGHFLPYINVAELNKTVEKLLVKGVTFGVISWLPWQISTEYEEICRTEKIEWVNKNLPFVSEINCISYGIPKQKAIQKRTSTMYLIDDNAQICNAWNTSYQRKSVKVDKDFNVVDALKTILNFADLE